MVLWYAWPGGVEKFFASDISDRRRLDSIRLGRPGDTVVHPGAENRAAA